MANNVEMHGETSLDAQASDAAPTPAAASTVSPSASAHAVQAESGVDWRALWIADRGDYGGAEDVEFWDRRAPVFAATCQRTPYADEYLTKAGVRPGETAIDMGCGTGTLALPLAAEGNRVIACDLSGRMLEILEEQAVAGGVRDRLDIRRVSWLADWDDLPVADVFLASRSLYSFDLYETILKIERHARRRVCLTVSTLESPSHDAPMLAAIGRAGTRKAEHVYILNLLMQMGRKPELSYIICNRPVPGKTLADLHESFEHEDGPFTSEESALLEDFIARNYTETVDDEGMPCLERAYDRIVRWAFIAWDL